MCQQEATETKPENNQEGNQKTATEGYQEREHGRQTLVLYLILQHDNDRQVRADLIDAGANNAAALLILRDNENRGECEAYSIQVIGINSGILPHTLARP